MDNLELIEAEQKRLLEELSKCAYGSDDSKELLTDLKDLSAVADKAREQKIQAEKVKTEAENEAKERKMGLITAWIDAGAKIIIAGTTVVVCVLNNESVHTALKEVLQYESGGEYVTSLIGKSVIGGLFRRGK